MKSQKGVTLISLIVYVIAMLVTISIITVVTSYFYKNIDITTERYTYLSEFTKFESYFSEEVNHSGNKILEVYNGTNNEQTYIIFSSGNQYTYVKANKAIYQNCVKIASGVEACTFTEGVSNGHANVKVNLSIKGDSDQDSKIRTTTYTLKN